MSQPHPTPRRFGRVLVYGLGLSGRAALSLLAARGTGELLAADDRPAGEVDLSGLPDVKVLAGEQVPSTLPEGVEAVVLSPGVPHDKPLLEDARRRGVPVLAEVELAFPEARGPVVGITGSNGKSTTTALTGALLESAGHRVAVCGNIGKPLAQAVLEDPDRSFVVELSSFQLETIDRFHPKAAAYLNLTPDHLDRYPSLDAYAAAKERLFRNQGPGDVSVVNAADPRTREARTDGRKRMFSSRGRVEDGCWLDGGSVVETAPGEPPHLLFERSDLTLPGEHNLENAMAAALLARALGVESEALRRGLRGFRGLPHRMEKVTEIGGVTYYDDSKGTNTGATLRSLEGLPDGSVHLILGGSDKGEDYSVLAPVVRAKAARVYLIGESAGDIQAALGDGVPAETSGTLERAVESAVRHARPGETVLLSPACASFDQFRSFVHRGEVFASLVTALEEAR